MIEKLFRYLRPFFGRVVNRPWQTITISFLTAAAGFWLATHLNIDNDLSKLIPHYYPSVQALDTLREQVGAENEVALAIESPSFEANKQFAEDFIPIALALADPKTGKPLLTRAEYRKEIDFLKQHGLYFATGRELDLLVEYLEGKIKEAKERANPFYIELEEDSSEELDSLGSELDELYDKLIGSEYLVSRDSTILVIKFYPAGSQTDLAYIRRLYHLLREHADQMDPSRYHPLMEVTLAGRLLRTLIEVETITSDVKDSFGVGVLMLLLTVVVYFLVKSYRLSRGSHNTFLKQLPRTPVIALIIGLPLALSLSWTFGVTYLLFRNLNIMTSTLGLLLFGMGIDFGIHFFARYTEERGTGKSTARAIDTTIMTTGQAITVVGITTSAAFFILMIADFRGFSEFGTIAGVGILFAILAYVLFLPAMLVVIERLGWLYYELPQTQPDVIENARPSPPQNGHRNVIAWVVLGVGLLFTLIAAYQATKLTFEYDFGNLEPEYTRYNELNRKVRQVYSDRQTRNAAYIVTERPEEAVLVASILRNRAENDTLTPTIREIETFQDRYPMTPQKVRQKLERIEEIRVLLNDPFLTGSKETGIRRLREATGTHRPIPLEEVPDFIRHPFTAKSGEVGNLVIIYPSVGLADGRNSIAFANDVRTVELPGGKTYHAGSTSIVASDMLQLMIREAPLMVGLTILVIIIFKLLILRRVKWMVLALLPLAASLIWMFGLMETVGWKFNFYNLVVLPTVLGIGDDSGIHLVHRYLEEGKGSIRLVLRSTGEHIFVSGLTTIVGFGGLLLSIHPGLRSIGELAILGIGLTLVAALFLLPALLRILE